MGRRAAIAALALATSGGATACSSSSLDSASETRLAAGSLEGLRPFAPGGDLATLFRAEGEELVIDGPTFGYLRTEREFGELTLSFEWRWVEPGNSGMFLHVTGPDRIWPRTVEMQLFPDHAGDLLALEGFVMKSRTTKQPIALVPRSGGTERPIGEWNEGLVEMRAGLLRVSVNGVLANEVDVDPNVRGAIAFEAEGGEIHFRNVYVRE